MTSAGPLEMRLNFKLNDEGTKLVISKRSGLSLIEIDNLSVVQRALTTHLYNTTIGDNIPASFASNLQGII